MLFIASDDMRPEISPYGHAYMHTPNMQALQSQWRYRVILMALSVQRC